MGCTDKSIDSTTGVEGRLVADICLEQRISQAQYYQWRDHFMRQLLKLTNQSNRRN